MIVIGGTQRSGTSILARVLHDAEVNLGTEHWDERVGGGFESPSICNAVAEELGEPMFPYLGFDKKVQDDPTYPLDEVHKRFQVQKFSFLLMHPRIANAYVSARDGNAHKDTLVHLARPPEAVVRSKSDAEFAGDHALLHSDAHTLTERVRKSLCIVSGHFRRVVTLPSPAFLKDAEHTAVTLSNAGLKLSERAFYRSWARNVQTHRITERL